MDHYSGTKDFTPSCLVQESFKGEVIHTSEFLNAKNSAGKKVVIIGAGTSAHDVAADLVRDDVGEVVRYQSVSLGS